MSWLGILLIGFAVTDLTHSVRRTRYLPECVGAPGGAAASACSQA